MNLLLVEIFIFQSITLLAAIAVIVWPNVINLFPNFLSFTQSKMQKNNKCYDTLVKHHIYNLMLLFFKDIGPVLQTCLTQFQSGAPLVPLIKDEMVQLFTKIMQFFIK